MPADAAVQSAALAAVYPGQIEGAGIVGHVVANTPGFADIMITRLGPNQWELIIVVLLAQALPPKRTHDAIAAIVEVLGEGLGCERTFAAEVVQAHIGLVGSALQIRPPAPVLVQIEARLAIDVTPKGILF